VLTARLSKIIRRLLKKNGVTLHLTATVHHRSSREERPPSRAST
jgi:hypothetical protein